MDLKKADMVFFSKMVLPVSTVAIESGPGLNRDGKAIWKKAEMK